MQTMVRFALIRSEPSYAICASGARAPASVFVKVRNGFLPPSHVEQAPGKSREGWQTHPPLPVILSAQQNKSGAKPSSPGDPDSLAGCSFFVWSLRRSRTFSDSYFFEIVVHIGGKDTFLSAGNANVLWDINEN
jgi:hypothetical protein